MTTTTTNRIAADAIAQVLGATTGYGEVLLADIPAEQFAHMPHPNMNHPAFCIGHLAYYADCCLGMLGFEDRQSPREGYEALFKMGAECVEEDGKYPSKDELMAYYRDRFGALLTVLNEIDDSTLAGENPAEGRFKEMLPTLGGVASFMSGAHNMMHLGQVSAWRRAVGMGSAM